MRREYGPCLLYYVVSVRIIILLVPIRRYPQSVMQHRGKYVVLPRVYLYRRLSPIANYINFLLHVRVLWVELWSIGDIGNGRGLAMWREGKITFNRTLVFGKKKSSSSSSGNVCAAEVRRYHKAFYARTVFEQNSGKKRRTSRLETVPLSHVISD